MKFEVVIIGGGIAGISTAYCLLEKGVNNLLIIDKMGIGMGSTRWAAGIVSHLFTNKIEIELVKRSIGIFKRIGLESNGIFSYNRIGMLSVGENSHEKRLKSSFDAMQASGVNGKLIDVKEINDSFQAIYPEGLDIGVHCPESGYIDQRLFTQVTADILRAKGITILEFAQVEDISMDGEMIEVWTTSGNIKSERVVIAGGVWSKMIAERIGFMLPLNIYKAQAMTLKTSETLTVPVVYDLMSGIYARPDGQKTLVAGNGSKKFKGNIDSQFHDAERSFRKRLPIELSKRLRNIGDTRISNAWSGLYASTRDGRPLMGESEDFKNLYYVGAFQGLGVMFAPGCAEILSDVITRGRSDVDIALFQAERFRRD